MKTQRTLNELINFSKASYGWFTSNKDNPNTALGKAIQGIMPQIQTLLKPIGDLEMNHIKTIDDLMVSMCDEHHVEKSQQPNQPPTIQHKHVFTNLESYNKYNDKVDELNKENENKRKVLLETTVDIEPVFCTEMPPFKVFPPEIQAPFIGLVVREKKESEIKLVKS